jgi:lysophospholipase L1-like esterase
MTHSESTSPGRAIERLAVLGFVLSCFACTRDARPSSSSLAAEGDGQSGAASAGAVRFVGRVERSSVEGPRFAWSGTGVLARFEGSDSIGVRLGGGQQYTVVLDGAVQAKLVPSSGTTPIAQGLGSGAHTVEIYRRTEANQGESQFLGFELSSGGRWLAPPPPAERRLELIGDSISCGYGNEGADMNCRFSPDTENHYLSYGAIAARTLGAELVTIAWSGKGVVCNYGDGPDSCVDPLSSYYERILPERSDSQWDFSAPPPHAVVINLGTNDFSTSQDPTQAEFEAAYTNLLRRVRSKYRDAVILCTNGPMLNGEELSRVRTYIGNAVQSLNRSGDTKVGVFELKPQEGADGYGCDWHPSRATHQKLAAQLSDALKASLGW